MPFLLALVLITAAATAYVAWALRPAGPSAERVTFEVPSGVGARSVVRALHDEGLIREPRVFLALLIWQGVDRRVGEGLYDLTPAMDAFEIAGALERGGRPRTVRLVIPEGSRLVDVARRLHTLGLAERDEALALSEAPTQRPSGVPDDAGLEGYLFPAVYEVPVGEPPERTFARMVARFERELDDETLARVEAAGLTVHAWVTIASIVQSEAANDAEMPIIAGVFLNRLDVGMPLQSDPTVAYGLGKDLPALDFPGGDFAVDHPWNTYTRDGLPRGPIGNPGRSALESVLAPARTTDDGTLWLYFLHGVSAHGPVFRPNVDLDGHVRDVNRYLR
ncbi:MAG: endolytic transglycosylase MltG [Trueperaceae bacterium]|nr:endolytic transglycosylase MltG [Trueperaceae bacterium]